MSNYCVDCGSRTSSGICSNCQEELYIVEHQTEYMTDDTSDEFIDKSVEQRAYLKRREK